MDIKLIIGDYELVASHDETTGGLTVSAIKDGETLEQFTVSSDGIGSDEYDEMEDDKVGTEVSDEDGNPYPDGEHVISFDGGENRKVLIENGIVVKDFGVVGEDEDADDDEVTIKSFTDTFGNGDNVPEETTDETPDSSATEDEGETDETEEEDETETLGESKVLDFNQFVSKNR